MIKIWKLNPSPRFEVVKIRKSILRCVYGKIIKLT